MDVCTKHALVQLLIRPHDTDTDGTPRGGCSLKSCHGALYLGLRVWSLRKRMPEARLHVASVDRCTARAAAKDFAAATTGGK
jgi:hypothetical protein